MYAFLCKLKMLNSYFLISQEIFKYGWCYYIGREVYKYSLHFILNLMLQEL